MVLLCLATLSHYNLNADVEGKQKMISSIFPEKLIYSEKTYRTVTPSEILDLLYYEKGESKKERLPILVTFLVK